MRTWFESSWSLLDATTSDFRHLRPLVYQQNDDVALGVVVADCIGDLLKQNRLAGPRRGDYQTALAFTDRADQVQNAHFHWPALCLQL